MRGRWWVLAGIVVVVVVAIAVWWRQTSAAPRTPPEVAVSDPALGEVVAKARLEVITHPNDASSWGRLGETLLANGLLTPARECFTEAGRLDPKNPQWPYLEGVSLLLDDPVAALPCWQRAAECPGNDDRAVTARLRWAEALLANNRADEAVKVLELLRTQRPDNSRLQYDLGLLAVAQNNPQVGVEHFRQCMDDPSCRRKALSQLAALYNSLGKPAEAADCVQKIAELPLDYDWPDPFLESYLTLTVGREGLFLQAEKQQQQGNVRQAIMLYETVIRQYPDEARAYAKLGMLLAELGNYTAAENVLRAGLSANPNMAQLHFFLAAALFPQAERLGATNDAGKEKFQQVEAAARRAIELKPDHGFAYLYLGLALKNLGKNKEALVALHEAVRCTPDATDPHLHLGQTLWEQGQTTEALKELETAVRLARPSDQRPRTALDRMKAGNKPGKN